VCVLLVFVSLLQQQTLDNTQNRCVQLLGTKYSMCALCKPLGILKEVLMGVSRC